MRFLFFAVLQFLLIQLYSQIPGNRIISEKDSIQYAFDRFFDRSLDRNTIESLPYTNLEKIKLINSPAVYYPVTAGINEMLQKYDHIIVDGMPTGFCSTFPISAISDYNYFEDIGPMKYNNSLSGFTVLNTPDEIKRTFFDVDFFTDYTAGKHLAINQKRIQIAFGSPVASKKTIRENKKQLPSVLIAGNISFYKDPYPPYNGIQTLNDSAVHQLYNEPLQWNFSSGEIVQRGDAVSEDGISTHGLRKNAGLNSYDPYI